jgi:radical SAM superfamily enzyme YgiQ (UPF0313 family)
MHKTAQAIKQVDPKIQVVVGGPHPTVVPEETLEDENIDCVVLGEGELALSKFIERVSNREQQYDLDGIAYRTDGHTVVNPPADFISDLDSMPFPAWDLLDVRRYFNKQGHAVIQLHRQYMPIMTSRGCPYRCAYCHSIFGKKYRTRSPENIVEELKILSSQYGIREIHVEDDSFNIDLARAKSIFEKLAASGLKLKINFPNGIRLDFVDQELLNKMISAGVYRVSYAVETVSSRIQDLIHKKVDLDRASETITQTSERGISTNGYFMIGFPDETREEMLETIDYAVKSDLHTASFFIVTPFPGTELYRAAVQKGKVHPREYRNFHFRDVSFNLSLVPDDELIGLKRKAFRNFYSRPSRMWRIFKTTPNKMEVLRNFLRIQVLFFGR